MNISEVTAFLYALKPCVIRFGLENTRQVLAKLGNPQTTFRVVHVAGSNGKGSTCAFLDAVLRRVGFRVGLYTSPHLIDFRERFSVNGMPASDVDIVAAMETFLQVGLEVDPSEVAHFLAAENLLERMQPSTWYGQRGEASRFTLLTFFECTTVLAMMLFAAANVDVVVMETGMGGRLDATNVVTPMVSVITPIHLEHTQWLGDTLPKIAYEKAGIIKPGIPVVVASQHPEARMVFEQTAAEMQAPLSLMGVDFDGTGTWRAASFRVGERRCGPVRLGLCGNHQVINAATAVGCLPWLERELGPIKESSLESGLREVSWPGRFERFGRDGEWVLDGAHNPDGVKVLANAVRDVFPSTRLRLLFGVLTDKQAELMLTELQTLAAQIEFTRPLDERGRDPESLRPLVTVPTRVHASVSAALELLSRESGPPILVTGSLTIVGEARAWLLGRGLRPKMP
jgi:dihydrofolate synthase/folylpolyglutamate synthase